MFEPPSEEDMLFHIFDKNDVLNKYIGSVGAKHNLFRKYSTLTKPKFQVKQNPIELNKSLR